MVVATRQTNNDLKGYERVLYTQLQAFQNRSSQHDLLYSVLCETLPDLPYNLLNLATKIIPADFSYQYQYFPTPYLYGYFDPGWPTYIYTTAPAQGIPMSKHSRSRRVRFQVHPTAIEASSEKSNKERK